MIPYHNIDLSQCQYTYKHYSNFTATGLQFFFDVLFLDSLVTLQRNVNVSKPKIFFYLIVTLRLATNDHYNISNSASKTI